MDPLELLPAELWRLIFGKVEDAQDWLTLCRASPTFEGVVGDERTRVFLPQVFPLLRKYLVTETASELLPLRLVSKHWKKTVDTSLELTEEAFGNHETINPWEIGWKYNFSDSRIIARFLDRFGTHPGKPIIGSFVQFFFDLGFREYGIMMEYSSSLKRLMTRFGNQINKLRIFCFVANHRVDMFLDEVRSCVQLAPNLEGLTVRFVALEGDDFRLPDDYDPCGGIQRYQPITRKLKLKSFCFDGIGEPGALVALQNTLVRLCCNPKSAGVVGVPPALTTFPNLETASVELEFTRGQQDIANLMNSAWPLTRLTLRRPEDEVIPLDYAILECVEHFKGTLTSLWIGRQWTAPQPAQSNLESELTSLWIGCEEGSAPEPNVGLLSLDLPRLEYLVIHPQLMSRPLPLLANLPNLRKLGIFDNYERSDKGDVKRLFHFMETQLSEHKMWEVLPKLVKLEVIARQPGVFVEKSVCKVYHRENYVF